MKVFTMYLPQFHEVEENNKWWGKGFTEWYAVKKAEALFDTHEQPKKPLNNNYYDLMEKRVMEWQASLMHQYKVDGLCFYHYWFDAGRKILEKPAENLLKWTDINLPFCFFWANESWVRTWAKLSGCNIWASKFDLEGSESEDSILLEQKYGSEEHWRMHFDYLLPFFKDSRYIKKDNAPVFMIYKPGDISCLEAMRKKWNEWAIEEGFSGIFLIGACCKENDYKCVDADYYHEPRGTIDRMRGTISKEAKPYKMGYDDVWQAILAKTANHSKTYFGGFTGYDDTPRHGINGRVIYGGMAEKFQKYLTELLAKNAAYGNDITFINAWNEWGEGMYLEPDEKEGYAYLEAVAYAKEHYEARIHEYKNKRELSIQDYWNRYDTLVKNQNLVHRARIFDKWLSLKEKEVSLAQYFERNEISSVAIYGMGRLGKHLLSDLQQSQISVEFVIDKRQEIKNIDLPIYNIEAAPVDVDTVVVALDYEYEKVIRELKEKGFKNVLLIENVIDEMSATV